MFEGKAEGQLSYEQGILLLGLFKLDLFVVSLNVFETEMRNMYLFCNLEKCFHVILYSFLLSSWSSFL